VKGVSEKIIRDDLSAVLLFARHSCPRQQVNLHLQPWKSPPRKHSRIWSRLWACCSLMKVQQGVKTSFTGCIHSSLDLSTVRRLSLAVKSRISLPLIARACLLSSDNRHREERGKGKSSWRVALLTNSSIST
jgi:hypothetical protein